MTTPASAPRYPHLRRLGRSGLDVTPVCVGGSPLGSMPQLYGHEVSDDAAIATVLRTFAGPFNFLDTSNNYGDGASERRIGAAIVAHGGLPEGFVLATKVDRDARTGDFSGARVRASVHESLERLGVDRFDLLYLHDPEAMSFEAGMVPGGAFDTMVALREEGVAGAIGVAGGLVSLIRRYVETDAFDVLLTHNRYTLLDRSAAGLIDAAVARGMGVVNAAPYGGGMLAKGPAERPLYAYGGGRSSMADVAARMQEACARHGVPLAAAALLFSTRDPRIHSTVVGVSSPERLDQTQALLAHDVPAELWERLEELAPEAEHWLPEA